MEVFDYPNMSARISYLNLGTYK